MAVIIDALNKNRIRVVYNSPFTSWKTLDPLIFNYILIWISNKKSRTLCLFTIVFKIESSKHGILPWRHHFYLVWIEFVFKLNATISDNLFIHIPYEVVNEVTVFVTHIPRLFICCADQHEYIVAHLPYFHQTYCEFDWFVLELEWIFYA